MSLITTAAIVVYDPLSITFSVINQGGSAAQKQDSSSGEYTPDREITPLILEPNLQITDPEKIISDGDYTSSIINSRWYVDEETEANRVTSETSGMSIGEYGALTISRNTTAGTAEQLIYTGSFIDPRRNEVFNFRKEIAISCEAVTEILLSIEIDAPPRLPLSPFKNLTTRTINAKLLNGASEVPDDDAVFEWKVLEDGAFRAITDDDVFYVSGQDTKALVIDRRYIDKESIRVEAYHTSLPDNVKSAQFKAHRWYGQYEPRTDLIRGKVIHASTTESEVQITVTNRQGNITSPEKYFNLAVAYRKFFNGENWKVISYSASGTLPTSVSGTKYGITTQFGGQIRELSALRPMQIDGKNILINGKVACIQIPTTKSEL